MKRIEKIINHSIYLNEIKAIEEYEKNRLFCKHDFEHFVSVSRIAYILALENEIFMDKEIIYAAGLLHDIGRAKMYQGGKKHNICGSQIAEKILLDCGFTNNEIKIVKNCILNHTNKVYREDTSLEKIIKTADVISRKCFFCSNQDACKWENEKKNKTLHY